MNRKIKADGGIEILESERLLKNWGYLVIHHKSSLSLRKIFK